MKNRQAAFSKSEKMLKGALHCHTTRSDGAGSPEDVIRLHAANEYDFMAVTDHRIYNRKNFAPDVQMTILPAMEFDATFESDFGFRCFHTVSIGPDDSTNGFAQDQTFSSGKAANQQEYQPYLDWLHQNNNLTIYCHPEWSSTPTRYFDQLRGNFAMEIWNSGCTMENGMDMNAAYWDEILGQGQQIFGVATDDGHAMDQHCKGWVMVNAENTVSSILRALQQGAFYSSCGPVIDDFYIEDGIAYVTCEPCSRIQFLSDKHPTVQFSGDGLTRAQLNLDGQYHYVRVCVMNEYGQRAWTNPIFCTSLV